jgi:hypothetical protein
LAVVERVLRSAIIVEGAVGFKTVTDDAGIEKTVVFGVILLVVPIFGFFLFLVSAVDCDVATQVGETISECWDILDSVWVVEIARGSVQATWELVCMDIAMVGGKRVPTLVSTSVRACDMAASDIVVVRSDPDQIR